MLFDAYAYASCVRTARLCVHCSHTKICFQKDVERSSNAWKGDFNRCVSGLHSAVAASIVRDIEASGDTGAQRYPATPLQSG